MEFEKIYKKALEFKKIDDGNKYTECHNVNIEKQQRCCIFCGKKYPDVKFKRVAHAISESVGNKTLVSHCECDNCNLIFGSKIEDSFGKYIAPLKFVSQNYGKKNTNTIKDMPTDSSLSYGSYRLESRKNSPAYDENKKINNYIIEHKGTNILCETKEGFTLKIPRQKYEPYFVYLALAKMCYSILPLSELPNNINHIILLKKFAYNEDPFNVEKEIKAYLKSLPNKGVLAFYSGANPLNGVNIYLYKKLDEKEEYPDYIFQLDFNNFSIAIPILSDKNINEHYKFIFPFFEGAASMNFVDFSETEEFFLCDFSAQKIECPASFYPLLEDELRKQKLLKNNN